MRSVFSLGGLLAILFMFLPAVLPQPPALAAAGPVAHAMPAVPADDSSPTVTSDCGQGPTPQCTISTDQSQYTVGEPVHICFTVPQDSYVVITDTLTLDNGTIISHVLLQSTSSGGCFVERADPPAGQHDLRLAVYTDSSMTTLLGEADAYFTVVPASPTSTPTSTPVPPTDTSLPPTDTPTDTPVPPTDTPTDTPVPPTDTPAPATDTPTGTAAPPPTNTPVPPPSSTPVTPPTNTPVTPPTNTPVTPPTNTPVPPPINVLVTSPSSGPPPPTPPAPAPTATRTSGSTAGSSHTGTSKAKKSTKAQPRKKPGRGPTLRVSLLTGLLRPTDTGRLAISYVADALVHITISAPGLPTRSFYDMLDAHNRLVETIKARGAIRLRNGRATIRVVVQATARPWSAKKIVDVPVSDLVVALQAGPIVRCVQRQTVRVAYHANTPLRIVLLYPHGKRVNLAARSDRHGNASARIKVTYRRAQSPVHIGVQVFDARPRTHRMEQTGIAVTLPRACR